MDASDDHINAWLEDLEPDEPLAVTQAPYDPPRRWNPIVVGAVAMVGVVAIGMGVVKFMNAGGDPAGQVSASAVAVGSTSGADDPAPTGPTPNPSDQSSSPAVHQGPAAPPGGQTEQPDGVGALGIDAANAAMPEDEPDPYDQTDPNDATLTQHLVRAANQWATHAGAEEAVRVALAKDLSGPSNNSPAAHIHAIQSLPFANIGRIVQVRAWVGDGVRSLWAVPVKDDGTVLAEPWLVSSEQRPLIDAVPEPDGIVDKEEATAVLTKAGWTQVEVVASGVHPSIPDILIVRATGVPPHGNQPVTNVVWLGGPAGSRHVMGV